MVVSSVEISFFIQKKTEKYVKRNLEPKRLLSGDHGKVTDQIKNSADKLKSLSQDYFEEMHPFQLGLWFSQNNEQQISTSSDLGVKNINSHK